MKRTVLYSKHWSISTAKRAVL